MKKLSEMSALELVAILNRNHMKIDIDTFCGTSTWEVYVADPGGHYQEDRQCVMGSATLKEGLESALEKALKHPRCFPTQPPAR